MSQYLLGVADLVGVVNSLVFLYKTARIAEDEPCIQVALERVAQVIQVAVVNGCLRVDPGERGGWAEMGIGRGVLERVAQVTHVGDV